MSKNKELYKNIRKEIRSSITEIERETIFNTLEFLNFLFEHYPELFNEMTVELNEDSYFDIGWSYDEDNYFLVEIENDRVHYNIKLKGKRTLLGYYIDYEDLEIKFDSKDFMRARKIINLIEELEIRLLKVKGSIK